MKSEYYIEFDTWNGTHTGTIGPFTRLTDAETKLDDIRTNGIDNPERFGLDQSLTHQGDFLVLCKVGPGACVGVIKQEWIRTNGAWQRAKPRVNPRIAMQFNFAKAVKPAPGLEYFVTGGYSGTPLGRRGPYQDLPMAQKGAHVLKMIYTGYDAWVKIVRKDVKGTLEVPVEHWERRNDIWAQVESNFIVTIGHAGVTFKNRMELTRAEGEQQIAQWTLDHDLPGEASWCRITQHGKVVEEYVRKPGEAAWKKVGAERPARTWFVVRSGGFGVETRQTAFFNTFDEAMKNAHVLQGHVNTGLTQAWIRIAEVPLGDSLAPDSTWLRCRAFQRKADGTWISATAASDGSYAGPGPYSDPQISSYTPAPAPPQKTWRRVERPVIFKFERPGEELSGTFVRLNEVVTSDGNFETVILKGPNEKLYSVAAVMLIDLVRNAELKPGTPMKIKYTGTQDTESGYPMKVYELYTANE